ncbi:MAG: cellulase family glycosylhydrolase [Opitutaceae bacterium]|nr:cellulase family glycosylhydrolase [Opitutaceae bacterium]
MISKLPLPLKILALCVVATVVSGFANAATFRKGVNLSHWLSQFSESRPYAAGWFTEKDIVWIAEHGYDHVRVPIDGRVWIKKDGTLDLEKVKPFDDVLGWARKQGLGVVLDMHFLPGADFNNDSRDTRVFTDAALQAKVADFWRQVAKRYAKEGDDLRFEILNEPVADENKQLNPFNAAMLAAIRESNPTRVVYLTSNKWSKFETVVDLEIPADPNVAITLHFYEPFVFTHQRASWVGASKDMPMIAFPGKVPELKQHLPADHFFLKRVGDTLKVEDEIDAPFAKVAAWAKKNAPGREIYIGEFGAIVFADDASRKAYAEAINAACERNGFTWAVWDYAGGFAVRGKDGKPTAFHEGLGLKKK